MVGHFCKLSYLCSYTSLPKVQSNNLLMLALSQHAHCVCVCVVYVCVLCMCVCVLCMCVRVCCVCMHVCVCACVCVCMCVCVCACACVCVCEACIHAYHANTGGSGACSQKILKFLLCEIESESIFSGYLIFKQIYIYPYIYGLKKSISR